MTPPFIQGIGRLATSRYDFQNHIDGYSFQHNASAIQLSPAIVISGTPYTNVAAAIAALNSTISASMLAGDADGYLLTNTVLKINGVSLPTFSDGYGQYAGALQPGNVLQVSGSSKLRYAPINLSGGTNYIIGTLPSANQSPQILAGDVVGAANANTLTLAGDIVGRAGATLVASIDGYPSGSGTVNVNAPLDIKKTATFDGYTLATGVPVTQYTTLPNATNPRTLIQKINSANLSGQTNIYYNSNNSSYEITTNCFWNNSSSLWVSLDPTSRSTLNVFGPITGFYAKESSGLSFPNYTWTDTYDGPSGTGWDDNQIQFDEGGIYLTNVNTTTLPPLINFETISGLLNPLNATEFPNTLYANNIVKAWGSFSVATSSNGDDITQTSVGDFFNISSAIYSYNGFISQDSVLFTFNNAFDDSNYSVVANISNSNAITNATNPVFTTTNLQSNTQFTLQGFWIDYTDGIAKSTPNSLLQSVTNISFVVLGLN